MSKIDYFSVLYPAVAALNPNDPQARASVYKRARTLLANRALDTAAGNAAISQELESLEEAIQRIEEEFSAKEAENAAETIDVEHLAPPPDAIDLEPGSGWQWKAAVAAALLLAIGIAGYVTFPFFQDKEPVAAVADRVISPAARTPDIVPAFDTGDGDHRPYTLRRQLVYYRTTYPPGAVVISKSQRFLYLIRPNLSAMRYSIAIGRKCSESVGLYLVSDKEEFPGWNDPEPTAQQTGGAMSPLLAKTANPLGARALYLERDDRSIHGVSKILGTGSSLACFQLVNEDIIDLYDRVPVGTRVIAMN